MTGKEINITIGKAGHLVNRYWMSINEFIGDVFNVDNPIAAFKNAIDIDINARNDKDDKYSFHKRMNNIDVAITSAIYRGRTEASDEYAPEDQVPIAGLAYMDKSGSPVIEYVPYFISTDKDKFDDSVVYTNPAIHNNEYQDIVNRNGRVPLSSVYQCLIKLLTHIEDTSILDNPIFAVIPNGTLVSIRDAFATSNNIMDDDMNLEYHTDIILVSI